jgi:hypothetical protein
MSLWMKHVVLVAVVAGVASMAGVALFWLTGSRRTAALVVRSSLP